jgi:hypothetical protein
MGVTYQYKAKNRFGNLEAYSREYEKMCDAVDWYSINGKWLENEFNRELTLVTNYYE